MENISSPPAELSTAFESETLRLRAMADLLLSAYEAAEVPKDHAGIARAARALITLNRLIKALYEKKAARQAARDTAEAQPEMAVEAEASPPVQLNRKERRRQQAELPRHERRRLAG